MGLTLENALTRAEVEEVVAATRELIQATITDLRPEATDEAVIRGLRQAADDVAELGRELLGRRPDLMSYQVPGAMPVRMLAHVLYGDHERATEIITLNPGLRRLAPIIPAGREITVYAE